MRYFLEIAYKGTQYNGWQIQKNGHTVQGELNRCLSTILRQEIEITGSGRTDTGVHATAQVAHFDYDGELNPDRDAFRFNSFLPEDIAVKAIRPVHSEAHARFDADRRSYEYHVVQHKDPFNDHQAHHHRSALDVEAMNNAAHHLLGRQDFESFSKVHTDVNNFFCDISRAEWKHEGQRLVFHISANRFLRNMVRAIVGTLLDIGAGKSAPDSLPAVIAARNRSAAGKSVPAHGLYLTEVRYPASVYLNE
ncbi:tRNA pseudouridine synthase A [Fulvitalea axinellae]|uniref:tRNA pseudouridine synthase A n=1 Tax=Fulvitalea axinellae TaxID=1182444 RepID=A0AAU9CHQ0_9BACT|nr:tRNA pseudouridine synthase A [Fulvitalea axinellae]